MSERPSEPSDPGPGETAPMPGPPDETVAMQPDPGQRPPTEPPPPPGSPGNGGGGSRVPWLAIAALAVGIGALVVGIIALTQEEDSAPAEAVAGGSIDTDSIADGAVTNPKLAQGAVGPGKLADGAVTTPKLAEGAVGETALADGSVSNSRIVEGAVGPGKLADGAVGTAKIQDEAVGAAQVAPDSLGGDQIDESTLGTVPDAENAELAAVAEVALALEGGGGGGAPTIEFVQAESNSDPADVKGPVVAECPDGSQVISGGAAVVGADGVGVPVALVLSTPSGNGWAGSARAYADTDAGWSVQVTATCATFGSS